MVPRKDTIKIGDEWYRSLNQDWATVSEYASCIGQPVPSAEIMRFRRPIAEPMRSLAHLHDENCDLNDCNLEGIKKPCNCHLSKGPVVKDSLTTENGGEVGTPRTDALVAEYTVPEDAVIPVDFARQLERELIAAIEREARFADGVNDSAERLAAAEKERDEWRDTGKALAESIFGLYAPLSNSMVLCRACNTKADSSSDEHPHGPGCPVKTIDAALAAYELKAKEGV